MTEGLYDPDGRGGNRGWADRLAGHLAAQSGAILYANLAVRGRRTHEIRADQLRPALELEPDLLSIAAGMNDLLRPSFALDQVIADMDDMLRAGKEAGATVLTMTFGDPVPINPYARVLTRRMTVFNERIRESAARHGAVLIDFATEPAVSDARFWCEDRLHANSAGHERIAAAAAEAMGLDLEGPRWNVPLDPAPRRARRERIAREVIWARRHLAPWIMRRVRKVSSGDGVLPKRPDLEPL